jgi:RNA polymerase sigma factor (sigma-70 family)
VSAVATQPARPPAAALAEPARARRAHPAARRAARRGDDTGTLVHAAAAGDDGAWTLLVEHFSQTIRHVARRHRLCDADQDEVVQRTWIRLVERIATVREPAALAGWLVTTARREALGLLAGAAREVLGPEPVEPREDGHHAEELHEAMAAEERRAALHRAIDGLPPHQRTLMRMLVTRPAMSYEEVGAALGMPVGSIGPTRGRSLTTLRRDPFLRAVAT